MFDVTAIGEALIDLTQTGLSASGVAEYAANPGGAPANLAVAAAKLGGFHRLHRARRGGCFRDAAPRMPPRKRCGCVANADRRAAPDDAGSRFAGQPR